MKSQSNNTDSEVVPDSYDPSGEMVHRTSFNALGTANHVRLTSQLPQYNPPQKRASKWHPDRRIRFDADDKYFEDEHCTVIYDRYPKSRFHLLVLPKAQRLDGPAAVTANDVRVLEHLASVAEWIAEGLCEGCEASPGFLVVLIYVGREEMNQVRCGVHATPSMVPLHIHIISQDFDSAYLKTKAHWNSFTTEFFVDLREFISLVRQDKNVADHLKELEPRKKDPLRCHRCDHAMADMKKLVRHIKSCSCKPNVSGAKRGALGSMEVASSKRQKAEETPLELAAESRQVHSFAKMKSTLSPRHLERGRIGPPASSFVGAAPDIAMPAASQVELVPIHANQPRANISLRDNNIKLGRVRPKCDVLVNDSTVVSGLHAELKCLGGGRWSLTDHSSNGTFVNGAKLTKGVDHELLPNDEIVLGPITNPERVCYRFTAKPTGILKKCATKSSEQTSGEMLHLYPQVASIKLGRNANKCDEVIGSSMLISGLHAEIKRLADGQWSLTDFSSNGTWMNGKKLSKGSMYTLSLNDTISFGGKSIEEGGDVVQYVFETSCSDK